MQHIIVSAVTGHGYYGRDTKCNGVVMVLLPSDCTADEIRKKETSGEEKEGTHQQTNKQMLPRRV